MKRHFFASLIFFLSLNSRSADLSEAIAIVGAGPSGIVAAAALQQKGYKNVTVFEKTGNIGGKVKTIYYNGFPYEMGAVVTDPHYDITIAIANELGFGLEPTPPSREITPDGAISDFLDWTKKSYGLTRHFHIMNDLRKFSTWVWDNPGFFAPGYAETPKELFTTFEEFMKNENMEAVLEIFRPVMVGCGYGYADNMPAPYWMKLMRTFAHERAVHFLNGEFYRGFKNGWQSLFEAYARRRGLDVRLNAEVKFIERVYKDGKYKINVSAKGETHEFDKVIVTVPHLAHRFMALDKEIQKAFFRVRTLDYKVTLVTIDGLPQHAHLFPRAYSYSKDKDGNANDGLPVLISSNQHTNVYQVYQFSQQGKTSQELLQIMQQSIERMQVSIKSVIAEEMYDYFPHFDAEAFSDGIPQELDKLQGPDIFFTGALFNFETVELSAMHAKSLIDQWF